MSKYIQQLDGTWYYKSTLAHWLDSRTVSIGEPTFASLPTEINPLQFLLSYIFGGNVAVVHIKESAITSPIDILQQVKLIRWGIPYESHLILLLDIDVQSTLPQTDPQETSEFLDIMVGTDSFVYSLAEVSSVYYLDYVCEG